MISGGLRRARGMEIARRFALAIDIEHQPQLRQPLARFRELARPFAIGDDHARAGIAEPVLQRLGAEQGEQRDGDGAQLVGGDMGVGGFGRPRQQDADAVARPDAVGGKQIGGLVGQVAELAIGEFAVAFRAHIDEREAARLRRRPAVAASTPIL